VSFHSVSAVSEILAGERKIAASGNKEIFVVIW
jgi:hypothetical protein